MMVYSGRGGRFGGLYPGGANGSLGLSSKSVSCGTPAAPDGLGTACALLAEDLLGGSFEPRGIAGGGPKGSSVSTPRFGCAGPAVPLSGGVPETRARPPDLDPATVRPLRARSEDQDH